jgi:hypothetical protein
VPVTKRPPQKYIKQIPNFVKEVLQLQQKGWNYRSQASSMTTHERMYQRKMGTKNKREDDEEIEEKEL